MTPLQAFRLWCRRAPLAERVGAFVAGMTVVALLAWIVVPTGDSGSSLTNASGAAAAAAARPGAPAAGGSFPAGSPAALWGGAQVAQRTSHAGGPAAASSRHAGAMGASGTVVSAS